MKFKVQTKDWTAALALASSITPSDVQGSSGYLCIVRGEKCYLYAEDGKQRMRVPIPVFDTDGEGAFVYPTGPQGDLRYVDGWVEFESAEEGDAHVVWCRRDTGGSKGGVHKIITFSAKALNSLDADLGKATKASTLPVVLLKEALSMTRAYLTDPKDPMAKPEYENLELFGDTAKHGNGYMLGCSANRHAFFHCPDLEGNSLLVHYYRIPLLLAFLSKSTGSVDVYKSENSTYFMNSSEQVLGWANQNYAGAKFGFYGLSLDRHIFRVARASLEKELRYVRSTLSSDRNKAFCSYDHKTSSLTVIASNTSGGEVESLSLPVVPLVEGDEGCWGPGDLGKSQDVQFNINLDYMIHLVEATKHPRDVILGVAGAKSGNHFLLRTIEDYFIDQAGKYVELPAPEQKGYACRALRYVPSKQ